MKLRRANSKDRAFAVRNRERKFWYRIGGFRTCANCDSINVFKPYDPATAGFTYYCYDCSAKDEQAWQTSKEIPHFERPAPARIVIRQEARCGRIIGRRPVRVFAMNSSQPITPAQQVAGATR